MKTAVLLQPLALVAAAAAFVLLPEISKADEEMFKALPVLSETSSLPAVAFAQTVKVPCPRCREKGGVLKLEFTVQDGSRLLLNGFELYPDTDSRRGHLTALLAKEDGSQVRQKLWFSLSMLQGIKEEGQRTEVIDMDLRVGNVAIKGIPPIKLQLLKAATEEIAIRSITIEEAPLAECSSLWCRLRESIAETSKLFDSAIGGCSRYWHRGHFGQHSAQRHHGHGHHRHGKGNAAAAPALGGLEKEPTDYQHNWRQLLRTMASHIILPVLMGITAGVGVAL